MESWTCEEQSPLLTVTLRLLGSVAFELQHCEMFVLCGLIYFMPVYFCRWLATTLHFSAALGHLVVSLFGFVRYTLLAHAKDS